MNYSCVLSDETLVAREGDEGERMISFDGSIVEELENCKPRQELLHLRINYFNYVCGSSQIIRGVV